MRKKKKKKEIGSDIFLGTKDGEIIVPDFSTV